MSEMFPGPAGYCKNLPPYPDRHPMLLEGCRSWWRLELKAVHLSLLLLESVDNVSVPESNNIVAFLLSTMNFHT